MLFLVQGKTFSLSPEQSVEKGMLDVFDNLGLSPEMFSFRANGKIITSFDEIDTQACIRASMSLLGGKGGYGAKLKTEGGKKVRPNDNMFSRDMSGQRIVNATMEREYKEFIANKIEEDRSVAKERQQFKVMESTLREGQSFMKLDKAYKRQIDETEKRLSSAIMIGKQRLIERQKQMKKLEMKQEKIEEKVEKQQSNSEQEKVETEGVKRAVPCERQEDKEEPSKKLKKDQCVKEKLQEQAPKKMVSSAEQRFKALFKKK